MNRILPYTSYYHTRHSLDNYTIKIHTEIVNRSRRSIVYGNLHEVDAGRVSEPTGYDKGQLLLSR
jgi:hypothetical protein